MNKYLVILLPLLFPCLLLAQNKGIRAIDNKGTIIYVDPSKWFQKESNLFNKNTDGNVAIGLDTTNVSFNSRLYISNSFDRNVPVLKLDTPSVGLLTDDVLTWDPSDFSVRKIAISTLSPNDWHILGNAGTDPATNFLGTTDNQDLSFRTYNTERMRIASSGNIGIGTAAPATTLEINSSAANTSGLRLTNLTSASPASTGATIGVNADGDVVVVNGFATTVSNTSVDNSLTTTVNSETGLPVTIINSNTLTATNGSLISTVNGIATPSVPVLVSANNGLKVTDGNVQLGGTLIQPTTINTNSNSFAISNLPVGAPSDRLVAIDPSSGVLKTVTQAMWSTIGNAGTTPGTNFLGTTDSQNLMFKIYNTQAGLLTTSNTSFGYQSLMTGTGGSGITAIGVNALSKGGDVADNTAVGYGALKNLTRTVGNTAIGGSVLGSFTGVLGSGSGYGWNTAVGYLALVGNISSGYNTALGASALNKTTGDSNTAVGFNALQNNTSGSNNIAVGTNALNIATTGNYNVAIGTNTGTGNLIGLTTGSNNILIGGSSVNIINASTQTVSNEMNIGNTLFGTGVNGTAGGTGGKIGVNTNAPIATLDVRGPVRTGVPDATSAGIGANSFAGGNGMEASGINSFAFGAGHTSPTTSTYYPPGKATGESSVAFGTSIASGALSFASGNGNTASGNYAAAFGQGNFATARFSVAVGQNNFIKDATMPAPPAPYVVAPTLGAGPATVSFAAGYNNQIAASNAAAFGSGNIVNGQSSVAMGVQNTTGANGLGSVAMGSTNTPSAQYSVAMGQGNNIVYTSSINNANYSVAMGNTNKIGTTVNSQAAFAVGAANDINGSYSNALGQSNIITNSSNSTTIGQSNFVTNANNALATGYNSAVNADKSTAMGNYATVATGHTGSFVIGDNNSAPISSTAANQFTGAFAGGYRFYTNRAGTTGMTMDALGNATFSGGVTATGYTPSDIRLKKDIQTLTGVLNNIKQLRGVNYYWKDASKGTDIQLGMIAQELEKVYPELVITNKDTGLKAVNYAQFTGVLVEGIKEQQTQIEDLKSEVETLKKQMQEIKDLLKK